MPKWLLDAGKQQRHVDLRPRIRASKGWCNLGMLAADLRLEVGALLRVLTEDRAKDHVWEVSGDWAWVRSGALDAAWRTNINSDLVTDPGPFEAYDRMVRTSGVTELRCPPEGAQWFTDANAAWDAGAVQPGPVQVTHINQRWM